MGPHETKRNVELNFLSEADMDKIHGASLHLLTKSGMRVGGERSLALLKKRGARVDGNMVFVTEKMVEEAFRTVPKELKLYKRDGTPFMTINQEHQVYYGTHSDQFNFLDPYTGQNRPFVRADTKVMFQLGSYLENMSFILTVGTSTDVPAKIQSQITFIDCLRGFDKVINLVTIDIPGFKQCLEMAEIVAGGKEAFLKKPFMFYYGEPIPPRTHPESTTERLWISAEYNLPVVYMPYSMMGGTAPMSFAASLAQGNAEVLFGVVLSQLIRPGAPFIYGHMPSILDMKSTIGSYGAHEFHMGIAAASQMSARYGLPFYGTAGCTDAKFIDEQAVSEVTVEFLLTALSKANLIHDIGVTDHCTSLSPELVVLSNELIAGIKNLAKGIEVNDETLALEVMEKVGAGGAYLTTAHTMKNFRNIHYSSLFSRKMNNPDFSEVKARIRKVLDRALNEHEVPNLPPDVLKDLKKYEEKIS